MSINQKALLQTVAIIIGTIGSVALMKYLLTLIGPTAASNFSLGLLLGSLSYLIFMVLKARLEYQASLDKLNSNK